MVGALGPPLYHLPGNAIPASVDFVYINLQPEYELPGSTPIGQFQNLGTVSPATLRKHFCTWSEFLFITIPALMI